MKKYAVFIIMCLSALPVLGQATLEKKNFTKFDGLFPFYFDGKTGKLYMEVEDLNKDFLYVYSLSNGIGSNDIGLDRGQLGNEQVVYFEKSGNSLFLVQPNLKYRAITENLLERQAVEQAFAKSILFGFEIKAEENGRYTIELNDFLMQDAHGVSDRLKRANQGSYSPDKTKSYIDLDRSKNFPQNTEIDVVLTFKGDPKGGYIRSVTPNPKLVTVAQHHSFIALPDDDFEMREFDPRSGAYPFSYYDYATPVQEPLVKRFITRHRLKKKNPEAEVSEAVEPIVYYLDNGTPEPIRTALLEGGRWWNEAFEAIGYRNAFQVKILPADADPLDIRYNVIQWVHRSTRGWSYGSSVTDPRTGEILKGHVSLGSLRIRQDYMIAQALMNHPFRDGDEHYEEMLNFALARIRQLSAHEIGHTLGFAHNFAASTNDRASVMDYPHPKVALVNGAVRFDEVYDTGIGEWDKVSVAYAYADFPEGVNRQEQLNSLLNKSREGGLRYISDQDARPQGGAHIAAHLWDNGFNAAQELKRVLALRAVAITNFGPDNIRQQEPLTVLEDVFVPLYFLHRYQAEAAVKSIGGLDYNYAVKGDGQLVVATAEKAHQDEALEAVLMTLDAGTLAIPKNLLELFPPRAIGYGRSRESFNGKTGVSFDALAAAETAADLVLGLLLHPERASRLIQQKSLDPNHLGLEEVLSQLAGATILRGKRDSYTQAVQATINFRVLTHLMNLASSNEVHPRVNALAHHQLSELKKALSDTPKDVDAAEMLRRIAQFYDEPEAFKVIPAPKIPDGSPIGMPCLN